MNFSNGTWETIRSRLGSESAAFARDAWFKANQTLNDTSAVAFSDNTSCGLRFCIGIGATIDKRAGTKRPRFIVLCKSQADQSEARERLTRTLDGRADLDCVVSPEIVGFARQRPAYPGASVAHKDNTSGTFGCLVRGRKSRSRSLFVLSNFHVLSNDKSESGDEILQPGPKFGGKLPTDLFAHLHDPILKPALNEVDAAIARVRPCLVKPEMPVIGRIGKQIVHAPGLNLPVHKFGARTGYSRGTFEGVFPGPLPIRIGLEHIDFYNVLQFRSVHPTLPFALPGDSGSLIVSQHCNRPVSLLFAGDQTTNLIYGLPIDRVLQRLGVQIVRTWADVARCR